MRTALIDGDTFIFAAASGNEYEAQWSPWLWTLHAEFEPARVQLDDSIQRIIEDIGADQTVVALTDETNWRKTVMPEYKHNRVAKRKPVIYKALREYVAEKYTVYQRPGLEGDDILGILATHAHLVPGEKILVSLDKDMQTIPGDLLNYGKARKAMQAGEATSYIECVENLSVAAADRWHYLQTLTGDVTDGYPGCPGVGAVNAVKLLDEGRVLEPVTVTLKSGPRKGEQEVRWEPGRAGTPWEIIVSAYEKAGLSESIALQNARVARILRADDYNFATKEVIPWTPK